MAKIDIETNDMYKNDSEKKAQAKNYKRYVDEHIENVNKAFSEFGPVLCKALSVDLGRLKEMITIHDQSKYDEEEFEGYRRYFYPTNMEENDDHHNKYAFDLAWDHHVKNNPHHPEFWVRQDEDTGELIPEDMPNTFIAEMLLDWQSMGYKFGDNAYQYWNSDKCKKFLSPPTKAKVEEVISIFNK